LVLVFLHAVLPGCATIHQGALLREEREVLSSAVERGIGEDVVVALAQEGTIVTIASEHLCEVRRRDRVRTTSYYDAVNASRPWTIVWTILGGLSVAVGVGIAAAAPDGSGVVYRPSGEDGFPPRVAHLAGAGMIGAGVGVLAFPFSDWIRARRPIVQRVERDEPPSRLEAGIVCETPAPTVGLVVALLPPLSLTGPLKIT
jgi:hypothetical protein